MIVLANGTRTARKDRKCSCCKKPILKGELYCYQTIKHDGEVYTWGTHHDSESGHCGTDINYEDEDGTFCSLCAPY